jgi:hypothetical protein
MFLLSNGVCDRDRKHRQQFGEFVEGRYGIVGGGPASILRFSHLGL